MGDVQVVNADRVQSTCVGCAVNDDCSGGECDVSIGFEEVVVESSDEKVYVVGSAD